MRIAIGGNLDRRNSRPLGMRGTLHSIKPDDEKPQAVLKSGGMYTILPTKRTPFHRRQQLLDLDLIPKNRAIVAVKIGYLVPELNAIARKASLALSPAAFNQDIVALQ